MTSDEELLREELARLRRENAVLLKVIEMMEYKFPTHHEYAPNWKFPGLPIGDPSPTIYCNSTH